MMTGFQSSAQPQTHAGLARGGRRPRADAAHQLQARVSFRAGSGCASAAARQADAVDGPIAEIGGDSHQYLFGGITGLAGELGSTVCVCDTGPADGTCNRKTHEIKRAQRLSANARLAAAIHEFSHALVGADEQTPKLTYAQKELVVESRIAESLSRMTQAPAAARSTSPGRRQRSRSRDRVACGP
jgi:hypothetical protein